MSSTTYGEINRSDALNQVLQFWGRGPDSSCSVVLHWLLQCTGLQQHLVCSGLQLLAVIEPLKRGLNASEEEKREVEELAQQLERLNPNPKALASPLINGRWELLYTTSESILGTKRPALFRPSGPIYQILGEPPLVGPKERR